MPVDTQRMEADVNITWSALAEATAAMTQVEQAAKPVLLRSGVKVDPRIAKTLDIYVANARPGEDRATARRRIEAAIAQGDNAKLSLKGLGLRELPPVLPAVFSLDISNNRITALPVLPCDIQFLLASGNRIKELTNPLPSQLVVLDLSHNALTSLPETLPTRLIRLDVQNNRLSSLPLKLPRELRIFNVASNRADLKEEASSRLSTGSMRRIFDVAMGGPGVSAARARTRLDANWCNANFGVHLAQIKPEKTE
ncbi:Leucine-rich repeat domain-containing protein [Bordetella sputigena]|uniref:hypothetical protein n=1 Tax=Bordetella sputigena TaxID=1416810 RepID=UPI0039F00C3C